ncbi:MULTISPECIES: LysR substrate-binding domain-containing protein [unclassified Phaeobacter]|uniref:LysR substrate-binding domain-containing protein n=1 Tax=unclassified Phaeobacter TaxID=2621772 RepID=UPI003A8AC1E0
MDQSNVQRRFLPSHSTLRSFECAARHQSYTLAAEELNLTQSAISRQIKDLESMIGVALFRRAGRRVVLTEAGQKLASEIAVDLENIHQTIMRAVSAGRHSMALRVAVLPGFASRWLIPKLPDFEAKHPDINLSLSTRLEPFDLEREHFDLAVHFGQEDWPDADLRKLSDEKMVPVASPEFVTRHQVTAIEHLAKQPLLHMATRPLVWRNFFQLVGVQTEGDLSGKYFDQFSMVISAAIASLGAALIPAYLIEKELEDGRLTQLSDVTITTQNSYYLVAPRNRHNQAAKAFANWMISSIADSTIL